jgi:protein phosphatase-4 regulatory subunit 3
MYVLIVAQFSWNTADDKDYTKSRFHFRDFFKTKVRFKQVVPITEPRIIAKIVETHRIQFLKDVALARLLDDGTFSTLSAHIQVNYSELVEYFKTDEQYLPSVCQMIRDPATTVERKQDAVAFLHELCTIVKSLPPSTRSQFFTKLGELGFFQVLENTLSVENPATRLSVISIIHILLECETPLIRSFVVVQPSFSGALVKQFNEETEPGTQSLTMECIRILLDTSLTEVFRFECISIFLLW